MKWTWAIYGKKTIAIGPVGGQRVYLVNTGNMNTSNAMVLSDMMAMCNALSSQRENANEHPAIDELGGSMRRILDLCDAGGTLDDIAAVARKALGKVDG